MAEELWVDETAVTVHADLSSSGDLREIRNFEPVPLSYRFGEPGGGWECRWFRLHVPAEGGDRYLRWECDGEATVYYDGEPWADLDVHTFATVLRLMEEDPEFTLQHSSPYLLSWIEEEHPKPWEQIARRTPRGAGRSPAPWSSISRYPMTAFSWRGFDGSEIPDRVTNEGHQYAVDYRAYEILTIAFRPGT